MKTRPLASLIAALSVSLAAWGCAPEPDAGGTPQEAAATGPEVAYVSSDVTGGLGLPFSEAARVGDLLFLSGMVGTLPGSLELVEGGLEAESRQALENIRAVLAEAGATPDDVVKCTVMLDDISRWGEFNAVYTEFFGEHRPARSAFGADGLAIGAAVEIECIAVLDGSA